MEGNHQWPIKPTHPHWFYGSYFYVPHPSETNSEQFLALPWAAAIQSPQADGKSPCIQVAETGISGAVSSSPPLHVGMLLHLNFLSRFNACSITWLSVPGDMSQKSFVPRNTYCSACVTATTYVYIRFTIVAESVHWDIAQNPAVDLPFLQCIFLQDKHCGYCYAKIAVCCTRKIYNLI